QNNKLCEGKSVLHHLTWQNSTEFIYFIGCANWKFNKKYHQFMRVSFDINIKILSDLFNGIYEAESNQCQPTNTCYTVFSNSSKKKYCGK
ncbi:11911_t:CDS:2, partial [Dentiscutata heterogama]